VLNVTGEPPADAFRDAAARIHRGRLRALFMALAAGTAVFACLDLVGASDMSWAIVVGSFVYYRAGRSDRILIWLRRFNQRERGPAALSRLMTIACRGVAVPITLQDSSFHTSYVAVLDNFRFFALSALLLLIALGLAFAGGTVLSLVFPRLDETSWTIGLLPLVVLPGLWREARRLGYRELEPDETAALDRSLAEVRNRRSLTAGILVLKCADRAWRDVVSRALDRADAVLIDVSDPSTSLLWELQVASKRLPPSSILLACRTPQGRAEPLPEEVAAQVRAAVGEEMASLMRVVCYSGVSAWRTLPGRSLRRATEALGHAVACARRAPKAPALDRPFRAISPRTARLVEKAFAVLVGLLIVLGEIVLQYNALSRRTSRFDAAAVRYRQRILEVAAAQPALAGLSDHELNGRLKELGRRGLVRLPNPLLLAWVSLMSQLLSQADTRTCAALIRDTASPLQRREAFSRLPSSEIDTWFTIVTEATLAEISGHPAPEPPTPDAISAARDALIAAQPHGFEPLLWRTMDLPSAATDEELCSDFRTVWRAVDELGEPHGTTLARVFAAE
jgi:hypothetical protein